MIIQQPTLYTEKKHIGKIIDTVMKKVLRQFEINQAGVEKLKSMWSRHPIKFICGSDGWLKDSSGTSGYMLFLSDSKDPLVTGLFSEHQSDNTASSTRLEMLAQLSVKYLFGHLFEVKGEPISSIILVSLVTDSQASNLIMDNLENITGPSTDISLGLGKRHHGRSF